MEHQTRVFEWRTKKENLPSPFLAAKRMRVFEPKTLSWTNNPSIAFFFWVISHRDDEWTRAHSLTFLSLFLSLSSCVQTRLLHSRLRDVHMKCTRHEGIRKQKREKENKKMCSRTPQEEVHRSESSQRLRENEFVRTYHSCELAYFNPSMTVLYICTPLARLNKGANAVVLEVNCFKVCLSAMMKSCVVVRVKCDDARSVPPLFHLSLSEGRIARSVLFLLFFCVF